MTLELHAVPDPNGVQIRVTIACLAEPGLAAAIDGRLTGCYRDAHLEAADDTPPWTQAIVRLKKRRSFIRRLETPERYDQSLVDSLTATMDGIGEPCTVQYALTPTPATFDRFARWLFRREERGYEQDRVRAEGGDAGIRSEVAQQELEGGLEVQNRPLFFCDLRVAAPTYDAAKRVAGHPWGVGRREPPGRAPHPRQAMALRKAPGACRGQSAALLESRGHLVLRAGRPVAPALSVSQGSAAGAVVGASRPGSAGDPEAAAGP